MINIQLDTTTLLTNDGRQFIIKKHRGTAKTGETIWEADSYMPTLEGALETYCDQKLGEIDCSSIAELITAIRELKAHVEKLCSAPVRRGRPRKEA